MKPILTALLLAVTSCSPAYAQSACGGYDQIVEQIHNRYGETLQSGGMTSSGDMLQVFSNDQSGSWTIIITNPNGLACVVSVGDAYHVKPQGEDT